MNNTVKIALVGIGGYGNVNLEGLLQYPHQDRFQIVAVIDPYADSAPGKAQLAALNVPFFNTLEECYNAGLAADFTIVSTPIVMHCSQTCQALAHGSHVMCEKPIGATIQEAHTLIDARDQACKWVGIGYQWSFTQTIQRLKADIRKGLFGAPKRFKTIVFWPRNHAYYHRNNWAGALRDSRGNWILDSPINNAVSHYLHNMFYLLGGEIDRSAELKTVTGEIYRANAIENFDSGALRAVTADGVEVLFYAAHACYSQSGPIGHYEFENAVVTYDSPSYEFVVHYNEGRRVSYGSPNSDNHTKIYSAIESILENKPILCGIEAAMAQTLCVNGLHESFGPAATFPKELIHTGDAPHWTRDTTPPQHTWVQGIEQTLTECYEKNRLPAENDVPWAKSGTTINLENYAFFPQRKDI